jgi:peptidoglycan-associated lipoprotein
MFRSAKVFRMVAAAAALSFAAGCAPRELPAAPAPGAAMAGAWYQIYFEAGSSDVQGKAGAIVKSIAGLVSSEGPSRVTVIGKTDRIGAPPANRALSRRRANAVRDSLIAAGVPAASIVTSWTGEAKQQMKTADEADEQGNRVVDITVLKLPR